MNTLYHDIVIDLAHMGFPESVTVKQYDDQIPHVRVELRQNGVKYVIPSGTTLRMQGTKPDKTHFMHDVIRTDDGRIDCPLTNQILAAEGPILAEIRLTDTTGELATFNFYILAQKAALSREDIESSDDYQSIDKIKADTLQYKKDAEAAKAAAEAAKEAAAGSANTATQQAQTAQLEAQKVKQIVAGNEAYTKTESDLKYTVAPRKEASSDTGELKLTDADDGLSYLTLQGNSEQYTNTANKNLIDLHFATDGYSIGSTGTLDKNEQYFATGYIVVEPGEQYTFTRAISISNRQGCFYDEDKVFLQPWTGDAGLSKNTVTVPENAKYLRLFDYISHKQKSQLEKGNVATDYVTGAVETPTPEYPSEVRSVGDIPKDVNGVEIRNLLDEEWIKSQPESAWERISNEQYNYTSYRFILPDMFKKRLTTMGHIVSRINNLNNYRVILTNKVGTNGAYFLNRGVETIGNADYTNEEIVYFYIFIHETQAATFQQAKEILDNMNLMVTEAATIDEYRPYIGENNGLVKIESQGVNHVDVNNVLTNMQTITTVNEDGSRIKSIQDSVNGTSRYVVYFNYKKNTQYSLYCKCWYEGETGQGASLIQIRDAGGASGPIQQTFAQNVKSDLFHTFNTGDNSNLSVWIYVQSVGGQPKRTMYVEDLMIVEGEKTLQEMKALKYQPYHQQITWIPLREPLQGMYGLYDTIDKNGYVTQRYDYSMTRLRDCVGISGWIENAFAMYFVDKINTERFVVGGLAYSDVAYVSNQATAGKPVMITTQGFSSAAGWYFAYYFLYGYLGIDKDATDAANKQKILDALGADYEIKTWYRLIDPIIYQIPTVYIETYEPETNVRCLNKVKPSDMTLDYKIAMSSLIKRLEALEAKTVQEV